ncbi:Pyridoxamine 5'-phosphate oxidase [Faunimonas pinastri]|uniref:Pyridoxine/pyridoxamine 5'-phosphate oxidase n=1 Tax=Faunimonas pinastri TaxID=1855383 RepID=A0A1H8ZYH7_9HYPH|nr:pyridoxamine 5'-phosphate oxidase [Faunimonas pinastri]SEP69303.1 Pyridoxamine 5'-phosphate oxidase [Faunimonas pinastri]
MYESLNATNPFLLFADWLKEAEGSEPNDPNAMALATVDESGMPDVRMVLLKGFDDGGFVFYTNLGSAKARELATTPKASLCFHWKSLRRQVRVRGMVERVPDGEADSYFASRPRQSRLGAWASRQSEPLGARGELVEAVESFAERFPGEDIPRPAHWSGYRLKPEVLEFWRDGEFRLHDRLVFRRSWTSEASRWETLWLYP